VAKELRALTLRFAAIALSYVVGLAIGSRFLLPLLNALPACVLMARRGIAVDWILKAALAPTWGRCLRALLS
jgi:hypothetical protein